MANILNILLCSSKLAFFVSIQSSELYIDWNANSISAALWLAEAKILVACGSIAISKKIWLATNVGFFQKLWVAEIPEPKFLNCFGAKHVYLFVIEKIEC